MDLEFPPEYETFRAQVRAFLSEHGADAPRAGIGGGAAGSRDRTLAWQKKLIENGYAARTIPKEYGGFGAQPDLLRSIIIDEEFARAGVSRGIGGQGASMLVPTLLEHGTEAQKRAYVGPTIRGEVLWCQGYSEPGSGSDLASLQTRAVEDGDDYVINGQKIWTSTAREAQMMFALVRTEPDARKHEGISYLVFPMSTPGIEIRPLHTLTGHAEFNEVFFSDVRVPKSSLVGRRGEGWKIANTTLFHERNMLASSALLDGARWLSPVPPGWPLALALNRVRSWRTRLRMVRWVMRPSVAYRRYRGARTSRVLSALNAYARRFIPSA